MEFTWPFMLLLLFTVPVLVAFYLWIQRRRQRYALRYSNLSLIKEALDRGPGFRRHVPPLMFLGAFVVMIIAMARPVAVVTLPSQQGTVILTIDVSGSMNADDLKPSRIEAAKTAARSFVAHQPQGVQVGVVSFSDEAAVLQPPTSDRDKVLAAIARLEADGGTAIGSAIKTSISTLLGKPNAASSIMPMPTPDAGAVAPGSYGSGIIVLLTDGENTWGPPPVDMAQSAAALGIRIYTVGIGSPTGSLLHINGQSIRAGLDDQTLKRIAALTGAKYYNAMNETDLRTIYDNLSARLVLKTQRTEITAGFTTLAALLSLAAALVSMLWFNRMPW
jgi:Ca-activated chloride channel homolog